MWWESKISPNIMSLREKEMHFLLTLRVPERRKYLTVFSLPLGTGRANREWAEEWGTGRDSILTHLCILGPKHRMCTECAAYKCLLNGLWGEKVVGGKSKLVSKHRYIIQCNIQLTEQKNIAIRMLMRGKRNKKTINPLRGESMFTCIPIARPHASHIFVIK